MKVLYEKGEAIHFGPESCGMHREVHCEALTGECVGFVIAPKVYRSWMPNVFSCVKATPTKATWQVESDQAGSPSESCAEVLDTEAERSLRCHQPMERVAREENL